MTAGEMDMDPSGEQQHVWLVPTKGNYKKSILQSPHEVEDVVAKANIRTYTRYPVVQCVWLVAIFYFE